MACRPCMALFELGLGYSISGAGASKQMPVFPE